MVEGEDGAEAAEADPEGGEPAAEAVELGLVQDSPLAPEGGLATENEPADDARGALGDAARRGGNGAGPPAPPGKPVPAHDRA